MKSYTKPNVGFTKFPILLILFLTAWFVGTPALAFWPPLRNVSAHTETNGAARTVVYQVQDPTTGQWHQDSVSYTGDSNNTWSLALFSPSDGIIVWTAERRDSFFRHWREHILAFAVFDPSRGRWVRSSVSYTEPTNATWYIRAVVSKDGVVAWLAESLDDLTSNPREHRVGVASYDPGAGAWKQSGVNYQETSGYRVWHIGYPVCRDGAAAWTADRYDDISRRYVEHRVGYAIYDPIEPGWKQGYSQTSDSATGLFIEDATIYYSVGLLDFIKGYDSDDGDWYDGPTKTLAHFVASPTSGNPPLTVWLTDMSIAGTSWSWNLGDGGTTSARSTSHIYKGYGAYTVTQTVTGPYETDSAGTVINTDSTPPTGSLVIDGGAAYTISPSVILTLSAQDNSGTVTSMQFSNDNTNWSAWESFTPKTPEKIWTLSSGDGQKWVYARFKDAAGNVSAIYNAGIILDTTPPSVASTDPIADAVGVSVKSVITATFSEAIDGATITSTTFTLEDALDADISGAVTYSGNTATFTPESKLDYSATYTAEISTEAKDPAGNPLAADYTWGFTTAEMDKTPPTVAITSPTSEPTYNTNNPTLNIAGTASDNVGVTSVTWTNSRGGSGACVGTTSWSVSGIHLQLGENIITVTASDEIGNTGTAVLTVLFTDITPPIVTITSPTSASTYFTNVTNLNLGGTSSDNFQVASVTWTNDRGGAGACTGTTLWGATGIPLLEGENGITVTALDASGNTGADSLNVVCDLTVPDVAITDPTTDDTYSTTDPDLDIAGTASDNVGVVSVTWSNNRGGGGTCVGTTSWSASGIHLQLGENIITVTTSDAAGNTAEATLTVTFTDDTPPTIAITFPTREPTYSTNFVVLGVAGTASDNHELADVTWSNDRGGSGSSTGTTSWNATGIQLFAGPNVVTVTAYDVAGNSAAATLTVTFTDITTPTVSISSPTAGPTYATTSSSLTLAGSASDNVGVTSVGWVNSRGGGGACTGTTNWLAENIPIFRGLNLITITAIDAAANESQDQLAVTCSGAGTLEVVITNPTANPTYSTGRATILLKGTASKGAKRVRWAITPSSRSGVCRGTTSWSTSTIALSNGENLITITAQDALGDTASDVLTVIFSDDVAPTARITRPTSKPTYVTTKSAINIAGTASDNTLVASVKYAVSTGQTGTCSGTKSWRANGIVLALGDNIITITATDRFGNTGSYVLTVTYVDKTQPRIAITSPTTRYSYTINSSTVILGGVASDDVALAGVTWQNKTTIANGSCTGTTSWVSDAILLAAGRNAIVVTAYDTSGNRRTDSITVTYKPL